MENPLGPKGPLQHLLEDSVDYAGLFPPAALPMPAALANYLDYRRSPDAWALGRFIAPAARLDELAALLPADAPSFGVSATGGDDPAADRARIDRFNGSAPAGVAVDSAELKVASVADVETAARTLAGLPAWYGEVALKAPFEEILDALAQVGGRAKVRMGGVTPEAFPDPESVARFLLAVTARDLPFKATAGLHHPVRGAFRLTYQADAPAGVMYGYLNLMAATSAAQAGAPLGDVAAILRLTGPGTFRADGGALTFAGGRLDPAAAVRLRARFHGFGSCSFREPIDELQPALAS